MLSIFLAKVTAAIIDFNALIYCTVGYTLGDWLGKLTSPSQPIRFNTETDHVFPKCTSFVSIDIFLDVVSRCFIENALNVTHEKKETSRCFYWHLALLKTKILWINQNLPSTYEQIITTTTAISIMSFLSVVQSFLWSNITVTVAYQSGFAAKWRLSVNRRWFKSLDEILKTEPND